MIGAGTMRAERYGKIDKPLIVVESTHGGRVDLVELLRSLRQERGSGPCSARADRLSTAPFMSTAWSTSSS